MLHTSIFSYCKLQKLSLKLIPTASVVHGNYSGNSFYNFKIININIYYENVKERESGWVNYNNYIVLLILNNIK